MCIVSVEEEGICSINFRTDLHNTLDAETARELVDAIYEVCEGLPHKILMDTRDAVGVAEADGRRIYSSDPKIIKVRIAEAVIVNSLANRIMANFYMKFDKPPTPNKVFTNEAEARVWLNEVGD